jgi:signal transduction histidine kinase
MKFTPKGYIKIKAELVPINEKNAIKFSIEDTGYGIKKEDQDSLFKLFSTLDGTKLINKSGTGIGLYQSNKYAKKLGFNPEEGIALESQIGKGSTFSFILENKKTTNNSLEEEI